MCKSNYVLAHNILSQSHQLMYLHYSGVGCMKRMLMCNIAHCWTLVLLQGRLDLFLVIQHICRQVMTALYKNKMVLPSS